MTLRPLTLILAVWLCESLPLCRPILFMLVGVMASLIVSVSMSTAWRLPLLRQIMT